MIIKRMLLKGILSLILLFLMITPLDSNENNPF